MNKENIVIVSMADLSQYLNGADFTRAFSDIQWRAEERQKLAALVEQIKLELDRLDKLEAPMNRGIDMELDSSSISLGESVQELLNAEAPESINRKLGLLEDRVAEFKRFSGDFYRNAALEKSGHAQEAYSASAGVSRSNCGSPMSCYAVEVVDMLDVAPASAIDTPTGLLAEEVLEMSDAAAGTKKNKSGGHAFAAEACSGAKREFRR